MTYSDCSDVTFLIPARIDSTDRLENLKLVLEFVKKHFDTNIIVLEADKKEQIHHPLIDRKIFIEDHDPVFHRTKYLNQMTRESSTLYIAIWDTDVLVSSMQIELALEQLRSEEADMIFPYDGRFYFTSVMFRQLYKKHKAMDVFEQNQDKFSLPAGHYSVGGAFMVKRDAYINAGMENENFYGWGPEDVERVKRWEILGCRIKRIDGALYHLHHPILQNSRYDNYQQRIKLTKELLRICSLNPAQLKQEVATWNQQ